MQRGFGFGLAFGIIADIDLAVGVPDQTQFRCDQVQFPQGQNPVKQRLAGKHHVGLWHMEHFTSCPVAHRHILKTDIKPFFPSAPEQDHVADFEFGVTAAFIQFGNDIRHETMQGNRALRDAPDQNTGENADKQDHGRKKQPTPASKDFDATHLPKDPEFAMP